MKTFFGVALLSLLAGCKVAATAEDFQWTVRAPSAVSSEGKLLFTVETKDSGRAIHRVPYVWKVEWVGVEGIRHQGYSYEPESIRVKGGPGIALVRVFAIDRGHHMVEVASASFEVTAHEPPVK